MLKSVMQAILKSGETFCIWGLLVVLLCDSLSVAAQTSAKAGWQTFIGHYQLSAESTITMRVMDDVIEAVATGGFPSILEMQSDGKLRSTMTGNTFSLVQENGAVTALVIHTRQKEYTCPRVEKPIVLSKPELAT